MSSFIYYFIPEDKDSIEKMNIFMIPKDYKNLRLNDIKENFPLPGNYYFRFKFEFNGKEVWIDFNNPNGNLPKFEGKIIMKVQRIAWEEQNNNNNNNNNNNSNENLFNL